MNETPDSPATEAGYVSASLGGTSLPFVERAGSRVATGIAAACPR